MTRRGTRAPRRAKEIHTSPRRRLARALVTSDRFRIRGLQSSLPAEFEEQLLELCDLLAEIGWHCVPHVVIEILELFAGFLEERICPGELLGGKMDGPAEVRDHVVIVDRNGKNQRSVLVHVLVQIREVVAV